MKYNEIHNKEYAARMEMEGDPNIITPSQKLSDEPLEISSKNDTKDVLSNKPALVQEIRNDQFKVPSTSMVKKPDPSPAQNPAFTGRAGGVYIPPHKLRALHEELMRTSQHSEQHQRLMWEMLRKSINGVINKVNVVNIQHVLIELLNENILRGKGV